MVSLSLLYPPLLYFFCAAAKKVTKKAALWPIAPQAKGAMLRVVGASYAYGYRRPVADRYAGEKG